MKLFRFLQVLLTFVMQNWAQIEAALLKRYGPAVAKLIVEIQNKYHKIEKGIRRALQVATILPQVVLVVAIVNALDSPDRAVYVLGGSFLITWFLIALTITKYASDFSMLQASLQAIKGLPVIRNVHIDLGSLAVFKYALVAFLTNAMLYVLYGFVVMYLASEPVVAATPSSGASITAVAASSTGAASATTTSSPSSGSKVPTVEFLGRVFKGELLLFGTLPFVWMLCLGLSYSLVNDRAAAFSSLALITFLGIALWLLLMVGSGVKCVATTLYDNHFKPAAAASTTIGGVATVTTSPYLSMMSGQTVIRTLDRTVFETFISHEGKHVLTSDASKDCIQWSRLDASGNQFWEAFDRFPATLNGKTPRQQFIFVIQQ